MTDTTMGFGPWPQPAPRFFEDGAPAVLHVPPHVQKDWDRHLGRRYLFQMATETIPALLWSRRNPGVAPVSDERFVEILCDGIFSKLLVEEDRFDSSDRARFRDYLDGTKGPGPEDGAGWFKADFSPMRLVTSDDDSATSASAVLFRRRADLSYEVIAIALEGGVFDPTMKGGWTLAKYFALQGAGVVTTILMHPKLHFPSTSIDAITRTRLPTSSPLKQYLLPHFRLALAVNYSVLYGKGTVMRPHQIYAPYPGTLAQHAEIVATLWRGMSHPDGTPNRAYPRYRMSLEPPLVHSGYGDFLAAYYDVLLWMTSRVVEHISPIDDDVGEWADHCASWLPGFPDRAAITREPSLLARALASIVLDNSVGHSADHYIYGTEVQEREVPFRLHTEVPSQAHRAEPDLRTLVTARDNFNYRMCMRMFFEPHVIERLRDVDYGFHDAELRRANQEFQSRIGQMDAQLESAGIRIYIPADEIATSVQY